MITVNTLYNFLSQWVYPLRQKRQIQDLLVYKKNIIHIRNAVCNGNSIRISYIKKSTKELKNYDINVKSYYIKRDTHQTLVFAVDLSDFKQKTFLLRNIMSVEQLNRKNDQKDIKIN